VLSVTFLWPSKKSNQKKLSAAPAYIIVSAFSWACANPSQTMPIFGGNGRIVLLFDTGLCFFLHGQKKLVIT